MGDGYLHNSEPLNGTGCENFSKGIVAALDMFNCSNYNEKNIERQRTYDRFYSCRAIKFFSAVVTRQDNTRQTVMHICG